MHPPTPFAPGSTLHPWLHGFLIEGKIAERWQRGVKETSKNVKECIGLMGTLLFFRLGMGTLLFFGHREGTVPFM